jgi:hypothetical protein
MILKEIHVSRLFVYRIHKATLRIRLVPVVVCLYLTLTHATSVFSPPLVQHNSTSRLQHPGYNPSASTISLLVSTTITDLTISEFIWRTMNLRKQIE